MTTKRDLVVRLVRARSASGAVAPGQQAVLWEDPTAPPPTAELEGLDAVVHLAGENIAAGRWTAARKERIRSSRVDGTRLLSQALARLERPPAVLACASAVGFYGDRGDEILTEDSGPGTGFLAETVGQWEEAAAPARERGIRVVALRFGVVLSPSGGALAKMLLPFRFGMGGRVGSGTQYMSWIALDDAVNATLHALAHEKLHGPVNAVAPEAVTNREFTRALGRGLHRPAFLPLPGWVARVVLGEMAQELLLSSTRVQPHRLLDSGFAFDHPDIDAAFAHLL